MPLFRNDSIMIDVFDVTADGQRFIVSSSAAQTQTAPFTVVVNWTGGSETLRMNIAAGILILLNR